MADCRLTKGALLGVLALALTGCTAQDRYYSVRSENLRECERQLTEVERQRCRERLTPASYEEYQRLRGTIPDSTVDSTVPDPVRRTVEDARTKRAQNEADPERGRLVPRGRPTGTLESGEVDVGPEFVCTGARNVHRQQRHRGTGKDAGKSGRPKVAIEVKATSHGVSGSGASRPGCLADPGVTARVPAKCDEFGTARKTASRRRYLAARRPTGARAHCQAELARCAQASTSGDVPDMARWARVASGEVDRPVSRREAPRVE